jgi:hypothetical protein
MNDEDLGKTCSRGRSEAAMGKEAIKEGQKLGQRE